MRSQTDNEFIVKQVRRWGSSTSDAILDPISQLFTYPSIEGLIGYRVACNCAVVLGDPVCDKQDIPALTKAFHQFCKDQNYNNIIYISATETFSKWAIKNICKVQVEFGNELFIDPHDDPRAREGVNASLVRRKVRHALNENCNVDEYITPNENVKNAIEQVGRSWLQTRKGIQIFTSHVRLFDDCYGKRWFYAHQKGKVVGVLLLNELQSYNGWLLNHLMFTPEAPHGTPELLVTSALETLSKENCKFVTFGTVPCKKLGEIVGLNKIFIWITRRFYDFATKFLKINGHRKFWEKFHPQSEKSFLLFSQPYVSVRESMALMSALNARMPNKERK